MKEIMDEKLENVAGGGFDLTKTQLENLRKLYPNVNEEGLALLLNELIRWTKPEMHKCVISNCLDCGKRISHGEYCGSCDCKHHQSIIDNIVKNYSSANVN